MNWKAFAWGFCCWPIGIFTVMLKDSSTREDKISFLSVLPNPTLVPEKGWTAEIGVQQGFKIAGFLGSIDCAIFMQDYDSMIDYKFDQYNLPS
jgi:hypothetical protein